MTGIVDTNYGNRPAPGPCADCGETAPYCSMCGECHCAPCDGWILDTDGDDAYNRRETPGSVFFGQF